MALPRKFQWALLAAGVTVLVVLVAERVSGLRIAAEQIAFEHTVAALRANLTAATTRALVTRDNAALAALDRANPFELAPGTAYRDFATRAAGDESAPGSWHFDPRSLELVYTPRFPEGFAEGRGRLRVRLTFDDRDGDGAYRPERDRLRSIALEVLSGPRREKPSATQ